MLKSADIEIGLMRYAISAAKSFAFGKTNSGGKIRRQLQALRDVKLPMDSLTGLCGLRFRQIPFAASQTAQVTSAVTSGAGIEMIFERVIARIFIHGELESLSWCW
jgi:hypothetical protein